MQPDTRSIVLRIDAPLYTRSERQQGCFASIEFSDSTGDPQSISRRSEGKQRQETRYR
jgi:hypothetical protein